MKTCPRCYENVEGFEECPNCGLDLLEDSSERTMIQPWDARPQAMIRAGFGKGGFDPSNPVLIYVSGHTEPLRLTVEGRVIIGRGGGDDSNPVDVDLNPFGGKDQGVSRAHAALDSQDGQLVLIDLGSTNGTFINERRIPRDQPQPLRNGDSARLGQVVMNIYFD
jgi:hypothetical protein